LFTRNDIGLIWGKQYTNYKQYSQHYCKLNSIQFEGVKSVDNNFDSILKLRFDQILLLIKLYSHVISQAETHIAPQFDLLVKLLQDDIERKGLGNDENGENNYDKNEQKKKFNPKLIIFLNFFLLQKMKPNYF